MPRDPGRSSCLKQTIKKLEKAEPIELVEFQELNNAEPKWFWEEAYKNDYQTNTLTRNATNYRLINVDAEFKERAKLYINTFREIPGQRETKPQSTPITRPPPRRVPSREVDLYVPPGSRIERTNRPLNFSRMMDETESYHMPMEEFEAIMQDDPNLVDNASITLQEPVSKEQPLLRPSDYEVNLDFGNDIYDDIQRQLSQPIRFDGDEEIDGMFIPEIQIDATVPPSIPTQQIFGDENAGIPTPPKSESTAQQQIRSPLIELQPNSPLRQMMSVEEIAPNILPDVPIIENVNRIPSRLPFVVLDLPPNQEDQELSLHHILEAEALEPQVDDEMLDVVPEIVPQPRRRRPGRPRVPRRRIPEVVEEADGRNVQEDDYNFEDIINDFLEGIDDDEELSYSPIPTISIPVRQPNFELIPTSNQPPIRSPSIDRVNSIVRPSFVRHESIPVRQPSVVNEPLNSANDSILDVVQNVRRSVSQELPSAAIRSQHSEIELSMPSETSIQRPSGVSRTLSTDIPVFPFGLLSSTLMGNQKRSKPRRVPLVREEIHDLVPVSNDDDEKIFDSKIEARRISLYMQILKLHIQVKMSNIWLDLILSGKRDKQQTMLDLWSLYVDGAIKLEKDENLMITSVTVAGF